MSEPEHIGSIMPRVMIGIATEALSRAMRAIAQLEADVTQMSEALNLNKECSGTEGE